jgi:hypothetical protein
LEDHQCKIVLVEAFRRLKTCLPVSSQVALGGNEYGARVVLRQTGGPDRYKEPVECGVVVIFAGFMDMEKAVTLTLCPRADGSLEEIDFEARSIQGEYEPKSQGFRSVIIVMHLRASSLSRMAGGLVPGSSPTPDSP